MIVQQLQPIQGNDPVTRDERWRYDALTIAVNSRWEGEDPSDILVRAEKYRAFLAGEKP